MKERKNEGESVEGIKKRKSKDLKSEGSVWIGVGQNKRGKKSGRM